MAINVRLTDSEDAALTALAEAEGVSKNDAIRHAIIDRHDRVTRRAGVEEATSWAQQHYRDLLDRLGQ